MKRSNDSEPLWARYEREFSELVPGGERTIRSGASFEKHDVRTKPDESSFQFLHELKTSTKRITWPTQAQWKELVEHTYSYSAMARPAWAARLYVDGLYRVRDHPVVGEWVILDQNDYIEMREELYRLRQELVQRGLDSTQIS